MSCGVTDNKINFISIYTGVQVLRWANNKCVQLSPVILNSQRKRKKFEAVGVH